MPQNSNFSGPLPARFTGGPPNRSFRPTKRRCHPSPQSVGQSLHPAKTSCHPSARKPGRVTSPGEKALSPVPRKPGRGTSPGENELSPSAASPAGHFTRRKRAVTRPSQARPVTPPGEKALSPVRPQARPGHFPGEKALSPVRPQTLPGHFTRRKSVVTLSPRAQQPIPPNVRAAPPCRPVAASQTVNRVANGPRVGNSPRRPVSPSPRRPEQGTKLHAHKQSYN